MSDKDKKDDQKGPFWQTLPGCITAIAGLITAIVGAVVALSVIGLIKIPGAVTPTPFSPVFVTATDSGSIISIVPSDILPSNIPQTDIPIPPISTITLVPPTHTKTSINSPSMALYSWWSVSREDNWATTNPLWTGSNAPGPDYYFVRVEGYVRQP